MINLEDVLDPEIYTRLTPAARKVVEDIYVSLSSYQFTETSVTDTLYTQAINRILERYRGEQGLANLFCDILNEEFEETLNTFSEYNYELFYDRMLEEINKLRVNYAGSLKFTFSEQVRRNPFRITFDREIAFGSPDQYVETARAIFNSKKSPEMKSRLWKILYKIAREGFIPEMLINKNKGKKKNKKKKKSVEDILNEYREKYSTTISTRLSKHKKAGFWYFLEYGNVNFRGYEGTPYPEYHAPPTGFIKKSIIRTESLINQEILEEYNRLKQEELKKTTKEEINAKLSEMIDGFVEGYSNEDKNLIRTSIRIGEELNRRLVVLRSKRYGIRVGVRKL